MNKISLGRAWSNAVGFFAGAGGAHAIILIVIGILVPALLQWGLFGATMATMMNPAAMMGGGFSSGMAGGLGIVAVIGYILSIGSYFASWRQGLEPGEGIGSALSYGMIMGAITVVALIALAVLVALVAGLLSPWLAIIFVPIFLVLLMSVFPAFGGLFAVAMVLLSVVGGALFAAMLGRGGLGGEAGAGGGLVFLFLLVGVLMLWLGARLSCVAPYLASIRSLNLLAGIRASWAMTAASQWAIMGYFLLIGLVLLVLLFIVGLVSAAGVAGSIQSNPGALAENAGGLGIGMVVVGLLYSIPMAYVAVALPGGIFKELNDSDAASTFA